MANLISISDIAASAFQQIPLFIRWVPGENGKLRADVTALDEGSVALNPSSANALRALVDCVPPELLPGLAELLDKRLGRRRAPRKTSRSNKQSRAFVHGLTADHQLSLVAGEPADHY